MPHAARTACLRVCGARARVRACACARMCVFACVSHVQELRPRCWLRTPALATLRPSMKLIYAVGWRPRHRPGQSERACGWYWDHNMASRAPTQRARVPLSLFHRARQRGVRTSRTSCGREVCVLSHTSMPATTRLAPNRGASRGGLLCPYHGASQRSTGLNEIRAKQQRHCCRLAELVTEHEDDHISNGAQTWRLRCGTRTSCRPVGCA